MPLIMTRVWPIAMVQLPTVIYMISHFENSVRIIYLDGRPHTDPDIVVRTFNGESIGRWEGDTLVVDTKYFPGHHHWMDQGGASVPVSEDAHIIERFKMRPDGRHGYRVPDDRSAELGGRVEDDQDVPPPRKRRYHRSAVPARPERHRCRPRSRRTW